MKIKPTDIISQAKGLGICDRANGMDTWSKLSVLLFSPQGREFCEKNKYPSIDQWRNMDCDLKEFNIYVDKGDIAIDGAKNIAIVGNTSAAINVSDNEHVTKIIVMHGAKVTVNASNYSVVLIVNIDGELKIEKDNTAVIL